MFDAAFVAQKRAIRAMLRLNQTTSCKPYFKDLGILPLPCLYIYHMILFVKKNPELFRTNSDISNGMSTRGDALLSIPQHTSQLYHRSVLLRCISSYNKIPAILKGSKTLVKFKNNLKGYLLENCFYSFNEFLNYNN